METTDEKPTIYSLLGITPDRGDEIAKDVADIMMSADTASDAFLAIAEKYDTESVLAGIRFQFLINISNQNCNMQKLTAKRQNSPMN